MLFIGDSQGQIIEFLQSCAQYFAPKKDVGEDLTDKNPEVMVAALQCWAFLLTSLDDDNIHDLFAPQVLESMMDLLKEEHDNVEARMLAGELLYILLSLEKEFTELDMVDMTKEDSISLFHERGKKTSNKDEAIFFNKCAAKLEGTDTEEVWFLCKTWWTNIPTRLQWKGWRIEVQLHALSKFFFLAETHMDILIAGPDYFMSLLGTSRRDASVARGTALTVTVRKVNKAVHEGASTSTKHHRRQAQEGTDLLSYNRYSGDAYWKDPDKHVCRTERNKESKYAEQNLHEYL